jgi:2-polyprenyl-6-methoxyphenol hydroxylase-like FAD-dependent oxidoreductase
VKALIAGGGIAGLATGIALRRAGLDVDVFERSPELREIGAGLMIWPNGARSLQALAVAINALTIRQISLCNWRGRQLIGYPVEAISERFGFDVGFVHRADLLAALADGFGREGLHLGADVSGYEDDGAGVKVILRDGTAATGDLLVGADGLRSAVRRQLLSDGDPEYLGSTIWRGIAKTDGIPLASGSGVNWFGRGSEFLAFNLPDHRVYWAGVTKAPRDEEPGPGGHKGDLVRHFGKWPDPVPGLIAATEAAEILRNDMYDRAPARRWSGDRVTLVGDAAHPMTPNMGQGACQALEDAVALGDSLKRATSLAGAFGLYEQQRLRRANRVVTMSRQATRGVQIDNPLLCILRDAFARALPQRVILRTLDATLAAGPRVG